MFKTFSAALLAAVSVAKGTGDGSSRENAVTTELISDAKVGLTLHSYNSQNGDTLELHGDLAANGGTGTNTMWYQYLVMGFCIQVGDTATWDCLRTDTNVNTSQDAIGQEDFDVQDFNSSSATVSALTQIVKDSSVLSKKASRGWVGVGTKSAKECTRVRAISAGNEIVNCSNVNAHFYRNFQTDVDSATDTTQDRQLAIDQAGTQAKIFGFFQDFFGSDYSGNSLVNYKQGATLSTWVAVYPAFKTAVDAAAAAAQNNNSNAGGSGALSLSTAAAAIAALYMAF